MNIKTKKSFFLETSWQIFLILAGTAISAIGLNLFLIPHHLLSGGVTGISMLLSYLTPVSAGLWIAVLNIPLFILAWRKIDLKFCILSLIGTLALAVFMLLFTFLQGYQAVKDPLLSAIFGAIISGGGCGLVIRARASQGGTDIISVLVRRKFALSIGTIGFNINIVIVALLALKFELELALITLFAQFISAWALDHVVTGMATAKAITIVSDKPDEIANYILKTMMRGVTFLDGAGGYYGENKKIIWCVVTTSQLPRVKAAMEEIDPKAFMAIMPASEIIGKGFYKSPF